MIEFIKKLTLADLCSMCSGICGFTAVTLAFSHNLIGASIFILAGSFLDTIDGKIAKLLNQKGKYGKDMDTLNDLVTFGVAPAAIIFNIFQTPISQILSIIWLVSVTLRLARFNVDTFDGYYRGVTSAIGALTVIAVVFFNISTDIAVVMFPLVSVLMVSNYKIKKVF